MNFTQKDVKDFIAARDEHCQKQNAKTGTPCFKKSKLQMAHHTGQVESYKLGRQVNRTSHADETKAVIDATCKHGYSKQE